MPRTRPLVSAALSSTGASIAQRAASLGKITSGIARTARTQFGKAHDPVLQNRKRLTISSDELAKLEQDPSDPAQTQYRHSFVSECI
jgi:hypothetical protein